MMRFARGNVEAQIELARSEGVRADLSGLDLSGLNLSEMDLSWSTFEGSNCEDLDFSESNISSCNFYNDNLSGAVLYNTNLHGTYWIGLVIERIFGDTFYLIPTPSGWEIQVGTFSGSPENLYPGNIRASDFSIDEKKMREGIEAIHSLCELHMRNNAQLMEELRQHWKRYQSW
ncbi:pentapeptide repeat-containing protein [Corynebacterium mastitidis]|uniref:pentapeptide repeat-containing protein n=1 Tax=Corynebacterium mastitidis TaxID=161890 RepID=UPI000A070072|nr:pentapeptide repeat-containing protein [Corynebacterium mastitidis]